MCLSVSCRLIGQCLWQDIRSLHHESMSLWVGRTKALDVLSTFSVFVGVSVREFAVSCFVLFRLTGPSLWQDMRSSSHGLVVGSTAVSLRTTCSLVSSSSWAQPAAAMVVLAAIVMVAWWVVGQRDRLFQLRRIGLRTTSTIVTVLSTMTTMTN